jgi:hypothetical protein
LLLSCLTLLIQQWPTDRVAWIGIYVRLILGTGLIATSVGVWLNAQAYSSYATSDMLLPTLVIVLVVISITFHDIELTFSFH